jgi:dTDP-4-dehydrorhamnose 3,5-epimerase-like enzyme
MQVIKLPTVADERGGLTIIEKVLPFEIKRVYYIYNVSPESIRGGHRHKKNWQALVCPAGACEISINNGKERKTVQLDSPDKCLVLAPEDWHTMEKFTKDAVLLVLASEYYDAADYIDTPYN